MPHPEDPRLRCPDDGTILRPFIPDNLPDDWENSFERTLYYCPRCKGDLTLYNEGYRTHMRLLRERAERH